MVLVIDVQPHFFEAEKIVDECAKEVVRARENNEWVAIVEFQDYGWTYPKITDCLKNYDRCINVIKKGLDGGYLVHAEALKKKAEYERVRVAGVYTSDCIRSTIEGLRKYINHPIDVLSHACRDSHVGRHKLGLSQIRKIDNVHII